MVKDFSKYTVYSANLLIVVVFTVSLFWCGDADCYGKDNDEQCLSLLCNLLRQHDPAGSSSQQSSTMKSVDRDGKCICQLTTIAPQSFSLIGPLDYCGFSIACSFVKPASLPKVIYHPPKA